MVKKIAERRRMRKNLEENILRKLEKKNFYIRNKNKNYGKICFVKTFASKTEIKRLEKSLVKNFAPKNFKKKRKKCYPLAAVGSNAGERPCRRFAHAPRAPSPPAPHPPRLASPPPPPSSASTSPSPPSSASTLAAASSILREHPRRRRRLHPQRPRASHRTALPITGRRAARSRARKKERERKRKENGRRGEISREGDWA